MHVILTATHGAVRRRFYFGFVVVAIRPLFVTVAASEANQSMTSSSSHNTSRRQPLQNIRQNNEWNKCDETFAGVENVNYWLDGDKSHLHQSKPLVYKNKLQYNYIYTRHLIYLCYVDLASFTTPSAQQKNPRGSRLIMDDGRPFGPGTTDTSSASKPDPTLQSPGAASLPLGSPNLRSKRHLPLKMFDFSNSRF